jgi:hypothetical protein
MGTTNSSILQETVYYLQIFSIDNTLITNLPITSNQ